MSCSEIRSLLALRSFDLLEEAQRSSVEAHLASCPACQLEVGAAGEVAAALKATRRDERPPERVWEALAKRLDAAPAASAPSPATATAERPLLQLACATCQGGLVEAVYCASCLAPHHADCFTTCTVHGCSGTALVAPRAPRARSYAAPLLVLGALAIGSIVLVQQSYDELLNESRKNEQLERDIKKFIIVKKEVSAPPRPPERIDVSSDGEDVRVVLDRIGKEARQNIVVDPDVKGEKVKISLRDVHWKDAVCVIASFVKCDLVARGDVLVLTPPLPVMKPETLTIPHEDDAPAPRLLKLDGFISSRPVINGQLYREGDELLGRDRKPFSPRLFLVKVNADGVEIATGSRDGARTVLTR